MGTTAQKGAYLNQTKMLLKDKINALGGDIDNETTFREYANQLDAIYDHLPKTSFEEGEAITLENTLKGKLNFDDGKVGFGQAKQETTQGYNELNIYAVHSAGYTETVSGVKITYNDDGSVTANGTATADINYFLGSKASLGDIFNGTYYLSGCTGGSGSTYGLSMWVDSTGVYLQTTTEVATSKTSGKNWNIVIMIKNGTTINKTFYPMMCATSGKTYEQYSGGYASPSPNWKQPIKYVRGKNLLPLNEADFTQTFYEQNVEIKDEVIKISGSATQVYSISIGENGLVLPSDTSRITFKVNSGTYKYTQFNSGTSYSGINVRLKDEDTDTMYTTGSTITLTETHTFSINLYVADTNSKNAEITIQLEEGTQATPYLPYNTIQETISGKNKFNVTDYSNFNVQPNVQAVITKETNKVKITTTAGNYSGGYVTYDNWKSYIDNYVEGENYYISFDVTANVNMTDFLYGVAGASAHTTLTANTKKRVIAMLSQNALVFYNMSGVVAEITIENIMITKASDSNYEPYITPKTYQLSLGDKQLYDECYIVGTPDNWKYVEWHEKIILKNLSWIRNGTNTSGKYRYYTTNISSTIEKTTGNNQKTTKGLYCNILQETSADQNFLLLQGICSSPNGQLYVYITSVSEEADTTALINLLTSTNAYAVIPLAQAKETPITDTTLISQLNAWYNAHSNTGTTIITSNGDLPMIIKVRGLKGE